MRELEFKEVMRARQIVPKIIEALLFGLPVKKADQVYRLDSYGRLAQEAHDQSGDTHLLIVDMGTGISMMDFIDWCLGFTDDEVDTVCANLGLNKIMMSKWNE